MLGNSSLARIIAAAGLFLCAGTLAQTQTTLLDSVHTVAAATVGVPIEETFQVSVPGTYLVTLTDLGAQLTGVSNPTAALGSVTAAVTSGNTVVGTLTAAANKTGVYTYQLTATAAGAYVVHVVGSPTSSEPQSGPIGLLITNTADGSQLAAFSDTLALPVTHDSSIGVLNDSFTITSADTYQVTLTDLQLPAPMSTLTLAVVAPGSSSPAVILPNPPSTGTQPTTMSATVTLQPGVYNVYAAGQACPASGQLSGGQACPNTVGGLYGVRVTSSSGAVIYGKAVPVGAVTSIDSSANSSLVVGNSYSLNLADLAFPAALSSLGAVVAVNGQSVAQLNAAGTQAFTAATSSYQMFALAVPAGSNQGSYAITLRSGTSTPVVNVARAVVGSGSSTYAYSYDATTVNGQTYSLGVADFNFPVPFSSLTVAAVQNGALLGTALTPANSPGTLSPVAGPVTLLVFAQPATAGGLFGLNLTASGAATAVLETTQGVGQPFRAERITVTSGGNYAVNVSDLGFPAAFASLAVLVTRGTNILGSAFTSGSFNFAATGGNYFVNFLAQPQGKYSAGTYSISVATAPAAPTLTLQAGATSVASGDTVVLSWSSQNATSCTASGGWSGSQAVSGKVTSPAITADTAFTLTCTGSGGSVTQSASVTVTASGGHGGGGVLGYDLIMILLGALTARSGRALRRYAE